MNDEMITVSRAAFEELLERDDILEHLEAAGIDKTMAYEEGMRKYYADKRRDEEDE